MRAGPTVAVFGYDELLLDALDVVAEGGRVAIAVLPGTRRRDPRVAEVRRAVEARGIPVLDQPRQADGSFLSALRAFAPDLALVWSYPLILREEVLALPRLGCLNLHMGMLPEYRGPNALQWAIVNGESHTGVTLHYMDAGIDTGPMLARARVPIGPDDDIVTVMRGARRAGLQLLREGWPHYSVRRLPAKAQDEAAATYWPRRTEADDRIDWQADARRIRDLVRATARPFGGAHASWRGERLIVRACEARGPVDAPAGAVVAVTAEGARVAAGTGSLLLTRLEQPRGALPVSALAVGDRLE